VVFEPKLSLVCAEESCKFNSKIDKITGIDTSSQAQNESRVPHSGLEQTLLYIDKKKIPDINERVKQIGAEHQDKINQVDAELDELINEVKTEYLDKNLASKQLHEMSHEVTKKYKQITKEENTKYNRFIQLSNSLQTAPESEKAKIQEELGSMHYLRKNTIANGRVPSDYEIKMTKLGDKAHFYDHKGQFISSTGHLIDDYALPKKQEKQRSKLSKIRQNTTMISEKRKNPRKGFPSKDEIVEQV